MIVCPACLTPGWDFEKWPNPDPQVGCQCGRLNLWTRNGVLHECLYRVCGRQGYETCICWDEDSGWNITVFRDYEIAEERTDFTPEEVEALIAQSVVDHVMAA